MVADTIAHEMAHLWCGDLVTMSWWSDLWLNVCYGPMSLASVCMQDCSDLLPAKLSLTAESAHRKLHLKRCWKSLPLDHTRCLALSKEDPCRLQEASTIQSE